mmetsp:Transcript_108429/g.324252  ORF Transcript_108429/g.324252 Transcript_108429/m.324252 type:complete len:384 (+) Transcript_108429:128-1279(+)
MRGNRPGSFETQQGPLGLLARARSAKEGGGGARDAEDEEREGDAAAAVWVCARLCAGGAPDLGPAVLAENAAVRLHVEKVLLPSGGNCRAALPLTEQRPGWAACLRGGPRRRRGRVPSGGWTGRHSRRRGWAGSAPGLILQVPARNLQRGGRQVQRAAKVVAPVEHEEEVHAPDAQVAAAKPGWVDRVDLGICQHRTTHALDVRHHDVPAGEVPGEVAERLRQVGVRRDVASVAGVLLVPAGYEGLDGAELKLRAVRDAHRLGVHKLDGRVREPPREVLGEVLSHALRERVRPDRLLRAEARVQVAGHFDNEPCASVAVGHDRGEGKAHRPLAERLGTQAQATHHASLAGVCLQTLQGEARQQHCMLRPLRALTPVQVLQLKV